MRKTRFFLLVLSLLGGAALQAAREIKPGFNLFSREQDVQLGREAQQQVEKQVRVAHDQPELENYISKLGLKLSKLSTAPDFPYNFHLVADKNVNAFALPGGPLYVHTATIAAAGNEAQLAGVMAHEISHVALRHSTHQASRAYAFQIPLALAGIALGSSGSLLAQMAELGISFGVNSMFLKYSRDAEREADLLGAQTMARAGYDPVEMARFFEKLEQQQQKSGGQPVQFFSDHPNPGNRVQYVEEEVKSLPPQKYTLGISNFSRYRDLAARVPVPEARRGYNHDESEGGHAHPEFPSSGTSEYRGNGFRFSYPANWQVLGEQNGMSVTMAPRNGLVRGPRGQTEIVMGAIAGFFPADSDNITTATNQLIGDLQTKNPGMNPLRGQRQSVVVDGSNGETVLLVGPSAIGNQREFDWLLTATRPDGLFYLVLVAPEGDYNSLRPTFVQMQRSVRFR
ncbi:MAG: M48 family metalloprotease [Acidobacteria bacterium]|nr:M48 family metalloprotease [Acidobacteriota bacterium]